MSYKIIVLEEVKAYLRNLPKADHKSIGFEINTLKDNPRGQGTIKLKGQKNRYRIRVRDFRVIFEIQDDILVVTVVEVGPRKDVYRL